jgi:hypothetical protein
LPGSSTTPACSSVGVASPAGATNQRPQPGQQLGQIEGLGQVIVGAGVEPGNLVGTGCRAPSAPAPAGCFPRSRNAFQYGEAVALRQAEIEDTGVITMIEQREIRAASPSRTQSTA